MIKQVKFKRLQVNAGFTLSIANGTMAVKISETHYRILGSTGLIIKADPKELVWADTAQIKRWYKW
ncbi:hypothetical protein R31_231 [Klebsiella phage R3_1]|nr:hypothetical protein R31_231 [Klebsiella phage R3_1]